MNIMRDLAVTYQKACQLGKIPVRIRMDQKTITEYVGAMGDIGSGSTVVLRLDSPSGFDKSESDKPRMSYNGCEIVADELVRGFVFDCE